MQGNLQCIPEVYKQTTSQFTSMTCKSQTTVSIVYTTLISVTKLAPYRMCSLELWSINDESYTNPISVSTVHSPVCL